ncbi:hypothetical protein [Rhizobium leguminosarum]|uniref:Uncharacterized protein n=1 Tax=Rhizobium leguminosarum TaxID=384 RepID=A0A7K3VFY6_RHILE|nr:hypothetical protein [Rhizobium leguminosarum]NEK15712.1 hypothetical protein [Rhizobium leguminosarum]
MNAHVKIQQIRRAKLEAYVEQLIALLDALDGDPELEDGGDDEPSFGCSRYFNGKSECELEEDPAELGIADQDALHLEIQNLDGSLHFDGDGQHIARKLLRENVKDKSKLARALDRTGVVPGYGRFV